MGQSQLHIVSPPSAGAPNAATDTLLNRELSWLAFNRRVLALGRDESFPLLERLRFLCICSTNLDEFFEIRVAGLLQQREHGVTGRGPDGLDAVEQLRAIDKKAHALVAEQYQELYQVVLPALRERGVALWRREEWSDEQRDWARRYFSEQVLPLMTPIGLDPAHPFPKVLNKSLNFIVSVEGDDAFARQTRLAIVQVPRTLPRVLRMFEGEDPEASDGDFVLLSSIIHENVEELFPGMSLRGCYQFRVTRNSDLYVDEEETDDLLSAIEHELVGRRYGDAVRLELSSDCPEGLADFLQEQFALQESSVYRVDGLVNLHRLDALHDLVRAKNLRFVSFRAGTPPELAGGRPILEVLSERDLLLHHPFQSFSPVMDMLTQAVEDPQVVAIKQTVYRTGSDSQVVKALVAAALAGKEVTAVIELRARFDEAANIKVATRLQEAGANVVYGVVGFKCHAKILMIVRREHGGMRRYVHLGTGNYHAGTARRYTDWSFMSAREDLGQDVHELFLQITGLGESAKAQKILHAPFTLNQGLLERIRTEIDAAKDGKAASIRARMNSLSDPGMIAALYEASQAGVKIDLLIRGICCLRPGVPGLSENIRVRSVLGRFLEHSRVFRFENGGEPVVFGASADWMSRNLHRRVETAFPLESRELAERMVAESLDNYFEGGAHAWELGPDGSWAQVEGGAELYDAQIRLLCDLSKLG